MPEEKFKRNIAYKLRIGDILRGTPKIENERFAFLELDGKRVVRVNLVGSVVDKYESEEKNYVFLTIDDGSGQIKIKAFGEDSEKLKNTNHGQTIILIGLLRYFNNEVYISPDVLRDLDPKYLLVRKFETEKQKPQTQNQGDLKNKIIEQIKKYESEGGIETEKIIVNLNEPSQTVNQEIQKLLEDGMIFEPRPGIVRWLG
tara:strand:+ start:240 stop:842 length:603 start_codon:yes stop_codon:yes gene_type:complete